MPKINRVNKRSSPKTFTVTNKIYLTPHMLRITLRAQELENYSAASEGGYIKLMLQTSTGEPVMRTYTVRTYRAAKQEIDVDFVVHETDGPAVLWAVSCQVGDQINVGGPGARKAPNAESDWVLMAGDMSALPAICAHLEAMEKQSKGYALLEIMHADDKQIINAPENIEIQWLINPKPEKSNTLLLDKVMSVKWLTGEPYIWVAGELGQSLAIRRYMKEERNTVREQMYASSYWQIGKTEDGHKISKRDAEKNR